MRILLENARIVTPGAEIAQGYAAIEGEVISSVGAGKAAGTFDSRMDLHGNILAPGFIDIHSHGRSNYDFCDGTTEAFATIGRDKLKDGVTGFLATTLTVSLPELKRVLREAGHYQETVRDGALLLGVHLEGPCINPHCAGAQNPAFLQPAEMALFEELNRIFPLTKVTFSPELPGGVELTRALSSAGIMPSAGHTEADYERFEECRAAGMKHMSHFCNVMTPLHHLRFGLVGAGLLDEDVYVEMICDGVHLCDPMIRLIARNKGPERMMLITDAMRASGMPDGRYSLGGLPVMVKDGRATLENGVVAGSTLRYFNGLKKLLAVTGMPLREAIRTVSLNQAESLHLGKRGKIEPGYVADLVVLSSALEPVKTICAGEVRWSAAHA